jgi:glutaredoxin
MQITVYTKTGCPWCIGVTEFLKEKNLPFVEKNVREDETYFAQMETLSGQTKAPVVIIDGFMLVDTDKEAVEKYLREEKGI